MARLEVTATFGDLENPPPDSKEPEDSQKTPRLLEDSLAMWVQGLILRSAEAEI